MYFADTREAIEISKNYPGHGKKGISCIYIIFNKNSKNSHHNDNNNNKKKNKNNNCKIHDNNIITIFYIFFFLLAFAKRKRYDKTKKNSWKTDENWCGW